MKTKDQTIQQTIAFFFRKATTTLNFYRTLKNVNSGQNKSVFSGQKKILIVFIRRFKDEPNANDWPPPQQFTHYNDSLKNL